MIDFLPLIGLGELHPVASEESILVVEAKLGARLRRLHRILLSYTNGILLNHGVLI